MSRKRFIQGTFILTGAGLLSRLMGFFYRIFLSHSIGAEGIGIYQLTLPLQTLILAFTTSGIPTALSRLTATDLALHKNRKASDCFFTGTGTALLLSVFISFFLYRQAPFFALKILKEERTLPLIRLFCFGIPLATLHSCVNSYFFARKKTLAPALLQLTEQVVRICVTYLLYLVFLSEERNITPLIAAGGSLASEGAAALISLFLIHFSFPGKKLPIQNLRVRLIELFSTALPLTLNRILLTLLGSMEVVMIPQQLQKYGLNPRDALSVYGIFTGMAFPLILFPSALTNSAAVMLMPSVAQLNALGFQKRILALTKKTCQLCFLLGSLCSLLFFFFGKPMGLFLFHSPTAGVYIRTMAFICPFLYLNTALSSILNGLGKSGTCLIHSMVCILIRIAFVLIWIPLLGIRGYLYGILLGELVLTLLHLLALFHGKPLNRDTLPIDN